MTVLSGLIVNEPFIVQKGAFLYSGVVLFLLLLQPIERDANRRSLAAWSRAGLGDAPILPDIRAAVWSDIAATLPRISSRSPRRESRESHEKK